jgi:tetratricopeptide (TPR) repeat protein
MAGPRLFRVLLAISGLLAPPALFAQAMSARPERNADKTHRAAPPNGPQRYADEPYVFEHRWVSVRFENNGSETRDLSARVRIQSDTGAQHFRQLVFAFIAPNEEVSVRSVTIRKPNAASVDVLTQPNATQVAASSVTQTFPAYTNLRELRVAVPSLERGDTLEYEVKTRVIKPFVPAEFWFTYDFPRDAISLEDRLELSLPSSRAFSIEAPGFSRIRGVERRAKPDAARFAFTRTEEAGRTILLWRYVNLKRTPTDKNAPEARAARAPDVQFTSFPSWAAVAHWYAQMEQPSDEIAPPVESKVEELIRGAANGRQRAQSIYAYVSQQIRDVDLSPDFGRLPPRAAQNVLLTGYGDSEEKNVLLAAMLGAAGIHSNPALIARERKLQSDFPSPAQFDHAITAVRDGEKLCWLDPSAQFAPFCFLPASLRGGSALLTDAGGGGTVVQTPLDPPFLSTQNVEINAQVSELGKLSGTVRYSLRGDTEYILRTAFHRAPHAQWNSLGQTILTLDGLRGHVTDVTTSDPFATTEPFQVTISFSDPSAFTWPMERAKIALPLLTIGMPDPPAKRGEPVQIGTPLDVETHLRLRFPPGFVATPPVGIAVARDYAEFKSSYDFQDGALLAERTLNFKMRELPPSRAPDYLAFEHAVQSDAAQQLLIADPAGAQAEIPPSASADDLARAGTAALQAGNVGASILLLERATELQPNHKGAWNELGLAYSQARRFADAAAAFQKQEQLNPSDTRAHDYLGLALEELHRDDDAADAFRRQIALEPLDPVAHAQLGRILLTQQRPAEAIPELEKAIVLSPEDAELEIMLARAYLNIGDKDRALASLKKATQLSPSPEVKNEAAYALAQQGADLDQAQQYAEAAIHATVEALGRADLAHLAAADLIRTANIGAYWDTLGWVRFRKGDLTGAKRYIEAAWRLTENGEIGDHLAQIYAKSGEKDRAIHLCALALAGSDPVPDTRARLMLLLGGNAQIADLVEKARSELETMRTFSVTLPVRQNASAEFLIAMAPDEKVSLSARVDAVRFVRGDESLGRYADALKSVGYGEIFPDPTPLKLIRRGTLTCSASGECRFTLGVPGSVPSAK